jgi:hypothetical protein
MYLVVLLFGVLLLVDYRLAAALVIVVGMFQALTAK